MVGSEGHARLKDVIRTVVVALKKYPVILMPLLLAGACDIGIASALALILDSPLAQRLGLLVSGDGGSSMLFLPRLFGYSKAVTGFAVGMILTGVTVAMLYQALADSSPSWTGGVRKVARRIFPFFSLWLASLVVMLVMLGLIETIAPLLPAPILSLVLGFAASCAVQMIFVFVVPVLIIENRKFWPALGRSLLLMRRHFSEVFLLVVLPNILVIPLLFIYMNLPELITRFSPSIVLFALLTRIVVVTAANFLISSTTTVLFIRHRGREKDAAAAYA